jgi:hypothetical protein
MTSTRTPKRPNAAANALQNHTLDLVVLKAKVHLPNGHSRSGPLYD